MISKWNIIMQMDTRVRRLLENGGRCIVHFAFSKGYVKEQSRFLAVDGIHEAILLRNGKYFLRDERCEGYTNRK